MKIPCVGIALSERLYENITECRSTTKTYGHLSPPAHVEPTIRMVHGGSILRVFRAGWTLSELKYGSYCLLEFQLTPLDLKLGAKRRD